MTTFGVLGTFAAECDGQALELGGPRQQAVLARLLVARGRVVSADRIVEDLWPGVAPPRALAGLQAYVSHLRRIIEPGRAPRSPARLLVTAPPGYLLGAGEEDVDAWRFEAAVTRAGELLAAGRPAPARATLDGADALWRGPAYGAFVDLPWASAEAARLDDIRATATERAADAAIRLGGTAEAALALRSHTAAHPLREEAWRLLALALYREGRQGEALAALHAARRLLADELGVAPGPGLRRLEADILAHAPHLEAEPDGRPGRPDHAARPRDADPNPAHPNPTGTARRTGLRIDPGDGAFDRIGSASDFGAPREGVGAEPPGSRAFAEPSPAGGDHRADRGEAGLDAEPADAGSGAVGAPEPARRGDLGELPGAGRAGAGPVGDPVSRPDRRGVEPFGSVSSGERSGGAGEAREPASPGRDAGDGRAAPWPGGTGGPGGVGVPTVPGSPGSGARRADGRGGRGPGDVVEPAGRAGPWVGAASGAEVPRGAPPGVPGGPAGGGSTGGLSGRAGGWWAGVLGVVSGGDPFVGRVDEQARVSAAAESVAAGGFGVVLLSGEPGAGKTALAERMRGRLAEQGWTAVTGRCPESAGAPAAWPWAQALRELPARDPQRARPEALIPLLDDAPGSAGAGEHSPGAVAGARFRGHEAAAEALAGAAAERPVLVVLDDLHHADGETLALLAHLPRHRPDARVLVLGTYRDTEAAGTAFAETRAQIAAHILDRVHLDGLPGADVAALVRIVCSRPVDRETVGVIAERTGGNPLFVRETARLLEAEGELVAVSEVPAGVGDVLRRRVARLPETARAVLRTAAVLGRDVDIDMLLAVIEGDEDEVVDAVESALVTGLIVEPVPGRIRFAHVLVRDTLYADLSKLRRGRVHRRIGAAIEALRPNEVAAAAHHFASAPGPEAAARAVHWGRLAAERAQRRFAHGEAVRLWTQTLDAHARTAEPTSHERIELTIRLIRASAYAGDLQGGRVLRRDALREAGPLGDPDLIARILVSLDAPVLWGTGRYDAYDTETIEAGRRVLEELPSDADELRCRVCVTLVRELEYAQAGEGEELAAEALAMARRLDDPELLAAALNVGSTYTFTVHGPDRLWLRARIGAELVALGLQHDLPGYVIVGHVYLVQCACARGLLSVADEHVALALDLADRYDLPLLGAITGWYRPWRLAATGRRREAEAAYEKAAADLRVAGQWQHDEGVHYLAILALRIGEGRVGELVEWAGAMAGLFAVAPAFEAHALALADSGRPAEARAVAGPPAPLRQDYFFDFAQTIRAMLGLALDDEGRIESAYRALLPYRDELLGGGTAMVVVRPAAHLLGDLAVRLGLPAEAHYEHAITVAERVGNLAWAADARAALARLRAVS